MQFCQIYGGRLDTGPYNFKVDYQRLMDFYEILFLTEICTYTQQKKSAYNNQSWNQYYNQSIWPHQVIDQFYRIHMHPYVNMLLSVWMLLSLHTYVYKYGRYFRVHFQYY